ncbi:hypothetical protein [Streptomyces sp. RFCAC02]|uniref:hypothetical protein n=1 Tax=Streptomyces sp. RFCAC02 TaxID=2499143 RepID=UPI00101F5437|nr:hypothetical protein [Streptomyces sp. RFCAC02]
MHVPSTLTRLLGASAYACIAYALGLVLFRHGTPRPHLNVIALIGAAAAATCGWIIASRAARQPPAPSPHRSLHGVPPPPRRLPPPRPDWGPALSAVLTACGVLAALVIGMLPSGAQGAAVNAIQRAGAAVATGAVVEPPLHVEDQHITYNRRHVYRSDLVLRVDTPSGPRRLFAEDARTVARPGVGEAHAVLYAPSALSLGAFVDELETDLGHYRQGWGLPPSWTLLPFLLGLVPFTIVTAYRLLARRLDPASRALRQEARGGGVRAARVTIVSATRRPDDGPGPVLLLRTERGTPVRLVPRLLNRPSGPGRSGEALLYMGQVLAGGDAWLCLPSQPRFADSHPPVVVVADNGRTVWARIDAAQAGALAGETGDGDDVRHVTTRDGRWCAPVPVLSTFRPTLDLPRLGMLAAAFALLLPDLLGTPPSVASWLLCGAAAALTGVSAAWPVWWHTRLRRRARAV